MTFSNNSCLICGTKVFFGEDNSLIKSRQEICRKFETLASRFLRIDRNKFFSCTLNTPDNFNGDLVCCFTCLPVVESFNDTYRTWDSLELEMFHILRRISNLMTSSSTSLKDEFVTKVENKRRQHQPYLRLEKQRISESQKKTISIATSIKSEAIEHHHDDGISDISTLNNHFEEPLSFEHYKPDYQINKYFEKKEMKAEIEKETNPVSNDAEGYEDYCIGKIEVEVGTNCNKQRIPETTTVNRRRNPTPTPCLMCGKVFFVKDHLFKHIRGHISEKPYHCSICQCEFTCKSNMTIHKKFQHFTPAAVVCNICGKVVTNLSAHVRIHRPNKVFCSVCGKGFTRQSYLKSHMATHTQERNFPCDICQHTFKFLRDVKIHKKRKHSGFQGIECDICGKVVKHIRTHKSYAHKKLKKVMFVCTICRKGFVKQSDLKKHQLSQNSHKSH